MTISDVRVGLRSYLLADSSISAMVDGSRIFPVVVPEGIVGTSVVISRISGVGVNDMQGRSGLSQSRMQIDCWATDADTATILANLVKERVDGFRGSIAWDENSPGNAVVVQGVFFDGERDRFDENTELYSVSRDYIVWYEE